MWILLKTQIFKTSVLRYGQKNQAIEFHHMEGKPYKLIAK